MALWGKRDQYSDAPKFVARADTGESGQTEFGSTVFGVDADETVAARGDGKGSVGPGWVYRRTVGSRVLHETLVALSASAFATGDSSNTANQSTTDVANTSGTADDTQFPDS